MATEERWQVFDSIEEADTVRLSSGDMIEIVSKNDIPTKCMVIHLGHYKYMLIAIVTGNRYSDTVVETYQPIKFSQFNTGEEYNEIRILLRGM